MRSYQAPPCSFMTAAIWHRRYKNNHLPNQFGQEVYKEEPVWSSQLLIDTPSLLNPSETRQFYKSGQDHCLKVHKNRFHGQVQPFSPFWFFPPKTLPCKVGLYQFFSVISVIVWIRPPWFCIAQFPEWLVVPNSGAGTKRLYLGGTCPNYESTSQYRFRSWRTSSHIITFSF